MKIKLIDTINDHQNDVDFGTCELCMYTSDYTFTTFIFDVGGKRREIDGYIWSWGDLFELDIYNTADFAYWLSNQEFPDDTKLEDFGELQSLVYDYYEWLEEQE